MARSFLCNAGAERVDRYIPAAMPGADKWMPEFHDESRGAKQNPAYEVCSYKKSHQVY